MASFDKRISPHTGKISWRVRIRRNHLPVLSKSFPNKTEARQWASDLSPVIRTTTKESFPYKLLERRTQDEAETIYRRTDYQVTEAA